MTPTLTRGDLSRLMRNLPRDSRSDGGAVATTPERRAFIGLPGITFPEGVRCLRLTVVGRPYVEEGQTLWPCSFEIAR